MKAFKTRWRTVQSVLNLGNRCTCVVSIASPTVDKRTNIPIEWKARWGPAGLANLEKKMYLVPPGNRTPMA